MMTYVEACYACLHVVAKKRQNKIITLSTLLIVVVSFEEVSLLRLFGS